MKPCSLRRSAVLGAVGLAVAAPLFTVSVATAKPSAALSRSVIYGTASEDTVTVYRQPLPQGAPETLFTYDSPHPGHFEGGPGAPQLTLSRDGRAVAYLTPSGVHVRDLDTGLEKIQIDGSELPSPGIADIAFSPDGRFLSFAGYGVDESTDRWVTEIATGRRWRGPGSINLAWSPSSDRVVMVGGWQGPDDMAVSSKGDYGTFQHITPAPQPKAEVNYRDSAFAPAGDRIAFTYNTKLGFPTTHIATSALDGRGFQEIDGEGAKEEGLAWDPTFDALYWIERAGDRGTIEVQYQRSGGRTSFDLPRDVFWVSRMSVATGGELVLVGPTHDFDSNGVGMQRLVVIGPDGHERAATQPFSQSTTFIGIV